MKICLRLSIAMCMASGSFVSDDAPPVFAIVSLIALRDALTKQLAHDNTAGIESNRRDNNESMQANSVLSNLKENTINKQVDIGPSTGAIRKTVKKAVKSNDHECQNRYTTDGNQKIHLTAFGSDSSAGIETSTGAIPKNGRNLPNIVCNEKCITSKCAKNAHECDADVNEPSCSTTRKIASIYQDVITPEENEEDEAKLNVLDHKWSIIERKTCFHYTQINSCLEYVTRKKLVDNMPNERIALRSPSSNLLDCAAAKLENFGRTNGLRQESLFIMITQGLDSSIFTIVSSLLSASYESEYPQNSHEDESNPNCKINFMPNIIMVVKLEHASYHAHYINVFYIARHFMSQSNFVPTKRRHDTDLRQYTFANIIRPEMTCAKDFAIENLFNGKNRGIYKHFAVNDFCFFADGNLETIVIGLVDGITIFETTLVPQACVVGEFGNEITILLYNVSGDLVGFISYRGHAVSLLVETENSQY